LLILGVLAFKAGPRISLGETVGVPATRSIVGVAVKKSSTGLYGRTRRHMSRITLGLSVVQAPGFQRSGRGCCKTFQLNNRRAECLRRGRPLVRASQAVALAPVSSSSRHAAVNRNDLAGQVACARSGKIAN